MKEVLRGSWKTGMLSAVRCGDGVNEAVGCCVVVYCVVQYSTVEYLAGAVLLYTLVST